MNDIPYKPPTLLKDDDFEYLKQPISDIAYINLEDDLLLHGCMEPILVWHGYIANGSKRYDICQKHHIPFSIRQSMLRSKEDVYAYICKDQLKRDDLKNEMYKYLIGRLYQAELSIREQAYLSSGKRKNESTKPYVPGKAYKKNEVSQEIADDLSISRGTVLKYEIFTKCIDSIKEKEPEIAIRILSGRLKISHANIIELERLPARDLKALNDVLSENRVEHITYSDIRHELLWKSIHPSPAAKKQNQEDRNLPIRQIPKYDPDSDLSTLIYTIPTWANSIKRSQKNTDFSKATQPAKDKVLAQLAMLKNAISDMEKSLKEEHRHDGITTICTTGLFRTDPHQESGIQSGIPEESVNQTRPEGSSQLRSISNQPGESES